MNTLQVFQYGRHDTALVGPDADRAVWVGIKRDGTLDLEGVQFANSIPAVVTPTMWEVEKANRQASAHRYGNNNPGAFVLEVKR